MMFLAGETIQFRQGIEEFNEYPETGMKAIVEEVTKYPEEGLFNIKFSYIPFEAYNEELESIRFRHEGKLMTYRERYGYESEESFCISDNMKIFDVVDSQSRISKKEMVGLELMVS